MPQPGAAGHCGAPRLPPPPAGSEPQSKKRFWRLWLKKKKKGMSALHLSVLWVKATALTVCDVIKATITKQGNRVWHRASVCSSLSFFHWAACLGPAVLEPSPVVLLYESHRNSSYRVCCSKIDAVLVFPAVPSLDEKHTAALLNLSLRSSDKHLSSGSSYTQSSF